MKRSNRENWKIIPKLVNFWRKHIIILFQHYWMEMKELFFNTWGNAGGVRK